MHIRVLIGIGPHVELIRFYLQKLVYLFSDVVSDVVHKTIQKELGCLSVVGLNIEVVVACFCIFHVLPQELSKSNKQMALHVQTSYKGPN